MQESSLVSVLMTAWNREKYIGYAIESVLASTHTNFELIIVDDASTDNTVLIAEKYAAQDKRIKIFINEHNLGDYPNRNRAASFATGKYLKYVDSDDYIYPKGLEIMVSSMEKFPQAGFGLCCFKQDPKAPFPLMLNVSEAYNYHFFGPGLFHKGPLTAIFVRSAFKQMGGFAPLKMIGDLDMWHRMGLQYPVVLMQDGLIWQRRHHNQELALELKFIFEGEKIKWKYLRNTNCGFTTAQLRKIKSNRLKRYISFIISGLMYLKFTQVRTYSKCFVFVSKINIRKIE